MSQKIRYVKHPISPKEKAAIRKAGYKIVDIRFKPADVVEPEEPKPVKKVVRRRTRAKKAE